MTGPYFNETFGFLPERPPLQSFNNKELAAWDHIMTRLPVLLKKRCFRNEIEKLPPFNCDLLETERDYQRAYTILTFIANAYIFEDPANPSEILPSIIAKPLVKTAQVIGINPVVTYCSTALYNWKLIDHSKPPSLSNLDIIHTFTGTRDEAWFYLIPLGIEIEGAPILCHIEKSYDAIRKNDSDLLLKELSSIPPHLDNMIHVLSQMHKECHPFVFYYIFRPYLSGSDGVPTLPRGVHYEGVDPEGDYRKYPGGSAGQSALLHALDVAFGVCHFSTGFSKNSKSPLSKSDTYLNLMRYHMPRDLREVIEFFAASPSIRDYVHLNVKEENSPLKLAFNECINKMTKFRETHLNMVARYIMVQSKLLKRNGGKPPKDIQEALDMDISDFESIEDNAVKGTGGTDVIPFLKQTRDETNETKLK